MRGRRAAGAPVTLFSFQDIITSVMGIMILVMLVIALELAARQFQSPAIQQAVVQEDVQEALVRATEQLERVKAAIAQGGWDDLAGISRSEIEKQTGQFERLIPQLEQDMAAARRQKMELERRKQDAEQKLKERRADEDLIARLQAELAAINEELSRLASSSTLLFRPSDTAGKAAWLVQVSDSDILAAPLGPVSRPVLFAGATPDSRRRQFLAWAADRNAAREYFVLLIKPGGAAQYLEIRNGLRDRQFDVGLDLIGSEQEAIDPERGAPVHGEVKEGV